MIRLILLVTLALFVVIGGLAVALYHFFSWKGLLAFPFILIAVLWLAKIVIRKLIKRFALRLFSMKSAALRGATMTVHAIKSVPKPPKPEIEPEEDDESSEDDEASDADDAEPEEPEELKDYVEVDLTITPQDPAGDSIWEPTELMLTTEKVKSLIDLQDKEAGTTHAVEIWNGTAFGPDDPGKYPGAQRLKITFAVKPGTSHAWLHYYNEPIGELKLPAVTIDV